MAGLRLGHLILFFFLAQLTYCKVWKLSLLNRKVDNIKEELKDEVKSLVNALLNIQLEVEENRQNIEGFINRTADTDETDSGGLILTGTEDVDIKQLIQMLQHQDSNIREMRQELAEERASKEAMQSQMDTLSEEIKSSNGRSNTEGDDKLIERLDRNEASVMAVRIALKHEKLLIRKFREECKQEDTQLLEDELEARFNDINDRLDEFNVTAMMIDNEISNLGSTINEVTVQVDNMKGTMKQYKNSTSKTIAAVIIALNQIKELLASQASAVTVPPVPGPTTLVTYSYVESPLRGPALASVIAIGSRVIRGADWQWGIQDGIPPGPGTVVGFYQGERSSQQVMVKWDRSGSANYRIGALGKYDLYLIHNVTHVTPDPDAPTTERPANVQPLFREALFEAIKIGSRVVRGVDWSWGTQDGTPSGPGTVISWYRDDKGTKQVIVLWDAGQKANYRIGAHGKYDLYLLRDQPV